MNTRIVHTKPIIGPSFQLLSNWCSMGCAGCGIHVSPPAGHDVVTLTEQQLTNVRTNLSLVKDALDSMGFEYGMVEQSGGEPTHHPQVVEAVGEVFEDCIHKIITNGLPSKSIYDYLRRRGADVILVVSLDHHKVEFNRIRLGHIHRSHPDRAAQIHDAILRNVELFARNNVPLVISTIISRWTIAEYLHFIAWLEERYPKQIQDGMLVPVPVSLVSFGNARLGMLNPSAEQVAAFEEAIDASSLLTVKRTREWLLRQMVGHYRNKQRLFEKGETLDEICRHPSRHPCEIFRYMMSFNFQDEEVLRSPNEALFEGYSCGVKVLGNIGYTLDEVALRVPLFNNRPSNMNPDKKYYRMHQVMDYVQKKESVTNDRELIQMGDTLGYFSDLRRGMCTLDDFDGVWWPLNVYLQGLVDEYALGEFWSVFRNERFVKTLRQVRERWGSDMKRYPWTLASTECSGAQ